MLVRQQAWILPTFALPKRNYHQVNQSKLDSIGLPDLLLSTLETHMLCKSPCYQAAGLGPAYSAALLCECVGHGYFSCLSPLHLMYVSAVPGSRNCSPRSIICKYKIAMCISKCLMWSMRLNSVKISKSHHHVLFRTSILHHKKIWWRMLLARNFCTDAFTHRSFYAQRFYTHTHRGAVTQKVFTQSSS